jgi:hypothetical protein
LDPRISRPRMMWRPMRRDGTTLASWTHPAGRCFRGSASWPSSAFSRRCGGGMRDPSRIAPAAAVSGAATSSLVVAEVIAIVAGIAALNGPLDLEDGVLPWVSLVVGTHFLALARIWRARPHWRGSARASHCWERSGLGWPPATRRRRRLRWSRALARARCCSPAACGPPRADNRSAQRRRAALPARPPLWLLLCQEIDGVIVWFGASLVLSPSARLRAM